MLECEFEKENERIFEDQLLVDVGWRFSVFDLEPDSSSKKKHVLQVGSVWNHRMGERGSITRTEPE